MLSLIRAGEGQKTSKDGTNKKVLLRQLKSENDVKYTKVIDGTLQPQWKQSFKL